LNLFLLRKTLNEFLFLGESVQFFYSATRKILNQMSRYQLQQFAELLNQRQPKESCKWQLPTSLQLVNYTCVIAKIEKMLGRLRYTVAYDNRNGRKR
jgi:hypothetical protein